MTITNKNFRVKNGLEVQDIEINRQGVSTVTFNRLPDNNGDAFWSNVGVLAQGPTLDDASVNNFNVIAVGSGQAGNTTQTKYQTGSFRGGQTVSDYINIGAADSLDYSANQLTIDFWVYTNENATSGIKTMASQWGGANAWIIQGGDNNNDYYALFQVNGQKFVYFTITPGQWNHIAAVRSGTEIRVYVNGVLEDTNSTLNSTVINNDAGISLFVNNDGPQQPFNGWIEDFRVTTAVRYTGSSFNPPAGAAQEYSTLPLTTASILVSSVKFSDGTQVTSGQGLSGYSGISGYSGVAGPPGEGTSGYSGVAGAPGPEGLSGVSGYSGVEGLSGYSGVEGPQGISGYSGYSGLAGAEGPVGPTGPAYSELITVTGASQLSTSTNSLVICSGSGNYSITLPQAMGITYNQEFWIKNKTTATLTILTSNSELIDTDTSLILEQPNSSVILISNTSTNNWDIF